MFKTKFSLSFVGMFFVLSFLVAGCGSSVVATVNGKTIVSSQLEDQVNQAKKMLEQQGVNFQTSEGQKMLSMLRGQVLEQMINEELLLQEASRLKAEPTPQQVADEIKNFREQFKSEAEYKQFLAANGFSEPRLKDLVKKSLAIEAVQKEAWKDLETTSEAQARDYYEKNKDAFTLPEQRQVRQILIPVIGEGQKAQVEAKVEAMNILNRLKSGEDFAALAREKSGNAGKADSSAGVETITRGDTDPELEKVVFNLQPGEISPEPVKTLYGYHVIKLEKIIPAQLKPFPQVKDEIVAVLDEQAKQKAFTAYLDNLRSKATIVNNLKK